MNINAFKKKKKLLFFVFSWFICFNAISSVLVNTSNNNHTKRTVVKESEITLSDKVNSINKDATLQPQQRVTKTVTGIITDLSGSPLPGVTIVVKGTSDGTITDIDGKYSLSNVSQNSILVFSFVGMVSQEILVGDQGSINLRMEEESIGLEEVVAVGYGTMKKQHLTGAVGSVKMGDLAYLPAGEFGQSLYGQVAGVQVRNTSGRPGQSSTLQIRGINSISASATPLVVIDGIILPDYDLSNINSADIESVDILKDAASAAIYGSRGANGVILITTNQEYLENQFLQ